MSTKDSLKRMRRGQWSSQSNYDWSAYPSTSNDPYRQQPYYDPSAYQQNHHKEMRAKALAESWAGFQKERPILSAFLVKLFGDKAIEVHTQLRFDISEVRAGDLLTALEDFDIDEFARLQG